MDAAIGNAVKGGDGGVSDATRSTESRIDDLATSDASVRQPSRIDGDDGWLATARVDEEPSFTMMGDGDLWPSCWSDDDALYAAWGDGWGFDFAHQTVVDIGVARIDGNVSDRTLTGTVLAVSDAIGQVWSGANYSRKPTGMVCVHGDLYLAVQDLAHSFDDAPAATIARSRDKGLTWEWDHSKPMFDNHRSTTIFFLDFGKDGAHAIDEFTYAYSLDGNWRDSFTNAVASPTQVFLARIPRGSLQNRQEWSWYTGLDAQGEPQWDANDGLRVPVLEDMRRIYTKTTPDIGTGVADLSVISQGSVVYNAPLNRYIYSSWTEYTYEFYEAPHPWGPFTLFFSHDFGAYPWSQDKAGGYATTIPSKFISSDGLTMQVQSNTFTSGVTNYCFSVRDLVVSPYEASVPTNVPGEEIPRAGDQAVTVSSSFHSGHPEILSDGVTDGQSEDSRTGAVHDDDFWGYVWPRSYTFNRVTYTTGTVNAHCGWFEGIDVQVRKHGLWSSVANLSVSPAYPGNTATPSNQAFTFDFDAVAGDGVRVQGRAGGSHSCTSVAELAVSYEPVSLQALSSGGG